MNPDTEKFRFRRFLEDMATEGEVDIVDAPTPLSIIAERLEGNPHGVWFRNGKSVV